MSAIWQFTTPSWTPVGNTPLVRLNRIVGDTRASVLVKLEYFNPAGSVKDRAAVEMVRAAESAGNLYPAAPSSRGRPAIPVWVSLRPPPYADTASSSSCPTRRRRKRLICCAPIVPR